MNYTEITKPGMGDPYWYEWSIGQEYIIDMINPDNNISSVSLQDNISLGLDDIVVKYNNGEILCLQVKHTRSNDTITFGDIVSKDDGESKGKSLLAQLAESWYQEKEKSLKVLPCIYTNRKIGETSSKAKLEGQENKYIRPALNEFWDAIRTEVKRVERLQEIILPKKEWHTAWEVWKEQLAGIPKEEEKIEFLKLLKIETNKSSLDEVERVLLDKLSKCFSITESQAQSLLASLDHALRRWATSHRKKIEVCVEDVYEALSLNKPIKVFNHDLRPPYPFFGSRGDLVNSLRHELINGKAKITFLGGLPGIGKTSVVSQLINDHERAIDIRYFAYEPIKVDSEYLPFDVSDRVNPDVFWGEMLSQLRAILKGKLYKYKVPLRNDFLSTKEIREKFLSIAERFGKDREKPVIIAIDGIDHAARAGIDTKTFLETLIDPEYISDNIKFFLSGQPIDSYSDYPRWLKNNEDFISYFNVPLIQESDILSLINSQKELIISKEDYPILAKLIYEFSQGNTLSAIFAVYEAKDSSDINEIKKKLIKRKLSGNIVEYYNTIWKSAIRDVKQYYPFIEYRLAGCFSLFSERINADILHKVFDDSGISKSDWNNILISLKPLIIEEDDGYRLIHNDIRVFLTKIINSDKNRLAEIASYIAAYYKKLTEPSVHYYNNMFKYLELSNREKEIVELFTPSYILGGYVRGLDIYDLKKQTENVFKIIREKQIGDWELIHQVTCAVNTLTQIEKSMDGEERVITNHVAGEPTLLESECSVIDKNCWNISILSKTLEDILMLFGEGSTNRAKGLFLRWFHDLTLIDLIELIPADDKFESFSRHKNLSSKKCREFFISFGRVLSSIDYNGFFYTIDDNLQQDELYSTSLVSIFDGYLWQSIEVFKKYSLARRLKNVRTFYWSSYDKIILRLIKEKRFLDLAVFIRTFGDSKKMESIQLIYNVVAKIIINDNKISCAENRRIIFDDLRKIELKFNSDFSEITAYCMLSFSLGALDLSRDSEGIVKIVLDKYFDQHKHLDSRLYGAVIFHMSALLGRWIYCLNNFTIKETRLFISVSKIQTLFDSLFNKKWTHHQEIYDSSNVKFLLLDGLNQCARITGDDYKGLIESKLTDLYEAFPVNYLLQCGWRYYCERNEQEKLIEWFNHWCGDEGEIWSLDLSQRNQIASEFQELILSNKLHSLIPLDSFYDRLRWSVIGYAYHKDYSLEDSLEWFKELIKLDISTWKDIGLKLMTISEAIGNIGDNRLDLNITSHFLSAVCREGIESVWKLYKSKDFSEIVCEDDGNLIDGIIGMLKDVNLSKQDMLTLWALGIGSLDWRNGVDQSYLSSLREAIVLASNRLKIEGIEQDLQSIGRAEYNCSADPVRFRLPSRWFENTLDIELSDMSDPENIVKSIEEIINNINDGIDNRHIILLLKYLKSENNELYKMYLKKVLYTVDSFDKGYGWSHSGNYEIYQYIVGEFEETDIIEFLFYLLNKRAAKTERSWELEYLNKDINSLCLWVLRKNGIGCLMNGMNRLIDMHFLWLTSDNHLSDIEIMKVEDVSITEQSPKTWSELVIDRLFYLLRCEDAEKVECSLRGIWALIKIDSNNIKGILDYWDLLHFRAQEWVLFIIEGCINCGYGDPDVITYILNKGMESSYLNVKLYSSVLMYSYCYKNNIEYPQIEFDKQVFFNDIPVVVKDIQSFHYESFSQNVTGMGALKSCIRYLEMVTSEDCSDILSKVLTYIKNFKSPEYHFTKFRKDIMKIAVTLPDEILALHQILYRELYNGRWLDVSFARICQAILSSTEPYILLESPRMAKNYKDWPVDSDVDNLLQQGVDSQKQKLKDIIIADVKEDELVLGAVMYTYSHKKEVLIMYTSAFVHKNELFQKLTVKATLNGRTYLLDDPERFEPLANTNLTYYNAGTVSFPNQSLFCYPSSILNEILQWTPILSEEIRWINVDDKEVVRFEYVYGKDRWTNNSENYRQPIMQRWIVKKREVEEIEKSYEVNLKSWIEIKSFDLE